MVFDPAAFSSFHRRQQEQVPNAAISSLSVLLVDTQNGQSSLLYVYVYVYVYFYVYVYADAGTNTDATRRFSFNQSTKGRNTCTVGTLFLVHDECRRRLLASH